MVLGKKVAIFDWEWAEIWPLEKGRKSPEKVHLHSYMFTTKYCSGNVQLHRVLDILRAVGCKE